MPYLANLRYEETACRQYLQDLFNSVELKDIVQRNKVRDVDMLERIIAYVTANIGTTFSSTAISKYLKSEGRSVSPETVLGYLKACTDAFLFYQVKRQDLRGKKILTVNEKYYVADHGVREAVFGGNQRDINLVLENIVYLELLRRGYVVTVGKVGDKEIDFICESQGNRLYIQVAYLLASEETIQREFCVYERVRDNYPKYVLTLDEFDMSRDGIKHRNIRDFLLEKSGDRRCPSYLFTGLDFPFYVPLGIWYRKQFSENRIIQLVNEIIYFNTWVSANCKYRIYRGEIRTQTSNMLSK